MAKPALNFVALVFGILLVIAVLFSKNALAEWSTDLTPPPLQITLNCLNASNSLLGTASAGQTLNATACSGGYNMQLTINCYDTNECDKVALKVTTVDAAGNQTGTPFEEPCAIGNDPQCKKKPGQGYPYELAGSYLYKISVTSTDKAGNASTSGMNTAPPNEATLNIRGSATPSSFASASNGPITVDPGQTVYLYYQGSGVKDCRGSWITTITRDVTVPGNSSFNPQNATQTAVVSCLRTSNNGSISSNITVNVNVTAGSSSGGASCTGTCGTSSTPADSNGAAEGNCTTSGGQNGWYSWDGKSAKSSCTSDAAPYCYSCQAIVPPTTSSATPETKYSGASSTWVSGPLLHGKIYQDTDNSLTFSGTDSLLSYLPSMSLGIPGGTIYPTSPNLMRGGMVMDFSYIPPVNGGPYYRVDYRHLTIAPKVINNYYIVNKPNTCVTTTTAEKETRNCEEITNVSGLIGIQRVITTTYERTFTGSQTWFDQKNEEYKSDLQSTSTTTLQAAYNYNSGYSFPSEYSTRYASGSTTVYPPMAGYCTKPPGPGYCANGSTATCDFDGTNCTCPNNEWSYTSCLNPGTGVTHNNPPWKIYREYDTYKESNGTDEKKYTGKYFQSTGTIRPATIRYSGMKIGELPKGNTDQLFDNQKTTNPCSSLNRYCDCNELCSGGSCYPDAAAGFSCQIPHGDWQEPLSGIPAGIKEGAVPPGNYQFKVSTNGPVSLTVNAYDLASGEASVVAYLYGSVPVSPGADGKAVFSLTIPPAYAGRGIYFDITTNSLTPINVSNPELYNHGLWEYSIDYGLRANGYPHYCAANLTLSNPPVAPDTNIKYLLTQTTDNNLCIGGTIPTDNSTFVSSSKSTTLSSSKIIEADMLYASPRIEGKVFLDSNRNGAQDGGEANYSGAVVNLNGASTPLSQTTGSDGKFTFSGLDLKGYTLGLSTGTYIITTPNSYSISIPPSVVAPNCAVANTPGCFGVLPVREITGSIFLDNNQDAIKGAGEGNLNLSGAVRVTQGGNAAGTVAMATDGTYRVSSLPPGSYSLTYIMPDNQYRLTSPVPFTVTVGSGCSIVPNTNTSGAALGVNCNAAGDVTNLNIGLSKFIPFLQTTGGGVHTEERINVPGGP